MANSVRLQGTDKDDELLRARGDDNIIELNFCFGNAENEPGAGKSFEAPVFVQ